MKFFFIRHAPVIGQQEKIYGDNARVDIDNHKDTIKNLSNILPRTNETLWYYSGVDRTLKTAQSILDLRKSKYILTKNELFKEQNFGALIGQSYTEAKPYLQWINGNMLAINPPNGDTIEDLKLRVKKGIDEVAQLAVNNSIENVVIFCHRGTIRVANLIFHDLPTDDFLNIDIEPLSYKLFCKSIKIEKP